MKLEGKVHELKTWPPYWEEIYHGIKTFEVRRDDRRFEPGDLLFLREWDPLDGTYTAFLAR